MPTNNTLSDLFKTKAGPAHSVQLIGTTTPASARFYTSTGTASRILAVALAIDVAGTDGSDVTIQIYRVKKDVAIASGQAILTAQLSLKSAANTVQYGTVVTNTNGYTNLNTGDSLAYIITGTPTAVQANLTVLTAVANGNSLALS